MRIHLTAKPLYAALPFKTMSRFTGMVSRIRFPKRLLRYAIDRYSSRFRVDTGEMLAPPEGFRTFNEFFTRRLKIGARKVEGDRRAVVSPVDGRIDGFGRIESAAMVQAKGIEYSLLDLVPSSRARAFIDGDVITIYLSPGDYHRIHSPVEGVIEGHMHVPGRLLSVRPNVARAVRDLYAKNERVITFIRTKRGNVAVCMVGAANVGSIGLTCDPEAARCFSRTPRAVTHAESRQTPVRRGEEIGVFNLGSTVIVLFEKETVRFTLDAPGSRIKMGQTIAVYKGKSSTAKRGKRREIKP